MRVLQVHTRYRETGGEDAVVEVEAELLRRTGHEVIQYKAENPSGAVAATFTLAQAPWNVRAAHVLRQLAERVQPDVAHVHNTWFALSPAVLPALRRTGMPVVMTLHNYRLICANALLFRDGRPCEDCVGTHPWHGVRHRCYRGSAALSASVTATVALHQRRGTWDHDVDLFLALTPFSRALLVRGGLPADRVRVKPNSVADPGPRRTPAARSRTVVFIGRLAPDKGVDVLLEAWRRLGDPSLELVVGGDGPARRDLERRFAGPGVRFLGRLEPASVRELMLSARALVFPSRAYESQPMVVLEALAAGLPVLASDLGGRHEILGPLGPAWLAPAGDVAGWTAALGRLADPGFVAPAAVEARALYERSFAEGPALSALLDAYEWARTARSR
jgi:glycosyltransferase involved in cell wall biosynthesis